MCLLTRTGYVNISAPSFTTAIKQVTIGFTQTPRVTFKFVYEENLTRVHRTTPLNF